MRQLAMSQGRGVHACALQASGKTTIHDRRQRHAKSGWRATASVWSGAGSRAVLLARPLGGRVAVGTLCRNGTAW